MPARRVSAATRRRRPRGSATGGIEIDNSCRIGRNDTGGRSAFGFRTEDGTHGADRTEVRRNKRENEKMKKTTKKPVLNVKKSSAKTVTNKKAAKKPAKKAK